ncbi:hypothetical protein NQ317_019610 [Molorchus minor]|uniref:Uncharacterized protein n=1 Tax=Molorchus minor TaxID=1323400 RepID=A0ABQ9J5V2_9CUCU|nr:hypothetical protein NQ317_019610 [Molorchus minor]
MYEIEIEIEIFQSEIIDGLHPAGKEYLTNQQPTKKLQDGCYDTVDGYFNPVTKCVYKDDYGDEEVDEELSIDDSFHEKPEILRVCTKMEEDFIVPNYRKAADDSVGYRPNLYEHWTSGIKAEIEEITKTEKHVSDITLTTLSSTESDTEDYDCSTFDSTSIHNSLVKKVYIQIADPKIPDSTPFPGVIQKVSNKALIVIQIKCIICNSESVNCNSEGISCNSDIRIASRSGPLKRSHYMVLSEVPRWEVLSASLLSWDKIEAQGQLFNSRDWNETSHENFTDGYYFIHNHFITTQFKEYRTV